MLILVGVVVSTTINSNLINKVKTAKGMHETKQQEESNISGVTVGEDQYDSLQDYVDGKKSVNVQVTLADGTKVKLTKENVATYLGKKVTNYTGQKTVTIGSSTYGVSTEYRLYYVDFDNKYGDGAGTIYLKAGIGAACLLPATDTSSPDAPNIKIKNLNPALYGSRDSIPSETGEVISPDASNENMKAVTWLLNTTNWASLADEDMSSNINYIVGAPSIEMMMDSYNTYYADVLTGTTSPDYSDITPGERRKLFYRYQSNTYGYQVGPNANNDEEYGYRTSTNSVYEDESHDMYIYPSAGHWLASPLAGSSAMVATVHGGNNYCVSVPR